MLKILLDACERSLIQITLSRKEMWLSQLQGLTGPKDLRAKPGPQVSGELSVPLDSASVSTSFYLCWSLIGLVLHARPLQMMEKMPAGNLRVLPYRFSYPSRLRIPFCQSTSKEGLWSSLHPVLKCLQGRKTKTTCLARELGHYDLIVLVHVSWSFSLSHC